MHVKRLTLIGVAAIAAGHTFLSNAGPAIDVPRARPAAASVAPVSQLARFDLSASLKPMPLALAGLDFEPVDVAGTPLASFTSLGGMREAAGASHSRLYRSFRMPDGRTLTLFEHELSADGRGQADAVPDDVERINGQPARIEVWQGDAGKAVSVLSWHAGSRAFQLWIDADLAHTDTRQRLLALAAALPGPVAR
jgi:hypothetical protein